MKDKFKILIMPCDETGLMEIQKVLQNHNVKTNLIDPDQISSFGAVEVTINYSEHAIATIRPIIRRFTKKSVFTFPSNIEIKNEFNIDHFNDFVVGVINENTRENYLKTVVQNKNSSQNDFETIFLTACDKTKYRELSQKIKASRFWFYGITNTSIPLKYIKIIVNIHLKTVEIENIENMQKEIESLGSAKNVSIIEDLKVDEFVDKITECVCEFHKTVEEGLKEAEDLALKKFSKPKIYAMKATKQQADLIARSLILSEIQISKNIIDKIKTLSPINRYETYIVHENGNPFDLIDIVELNNLVKTDEKRPEPYIEWVIYEEFDAKKWLDLYGDVQLIEDVVQQKEHILRLGGIAHILENIKEGGEKIIITLFITEKMNENHECIFLDGDIEYIASVLEDKSIIKKVFPNYNPVIRWDEIKTASIVNLDQSEFDLDGAIDVSGSFKVVFWDSPYYLDIKGNFCTPKTVEENRVTLQQKGVNITIPMSEVKRKIIDVVKY